MKKIRILFLGLFLLVLPPSANAQFFKKLLKTVGEVISDDGSSSSSSNYYSPVNSKGEVKIPAIVLSNPSTSSNYARSAGSIGTEWSDKIVGYMDSYERAFMKSYAGNDYLLVITNPTIMCVTIASVNGTKDDLELPHVVNHKGKNYLVTTIGAHALQSRKILGLDVPTSINRIGYEAFLDCKMKTFNVPSSIRKIDARAFAECQDLQTIYIPASVEEIGYGAFANCHELERIVVDEDNPYYKSVNGVLYNKEMTEVIQYPAGKKDKVYVAPNTIVSINRQAFERTWYLEDVVLPDGLMYISVEAFEHARLHNIYLPATLREIGNAALAFDEWIDGSNNWHPTNLFVVSNGPLPSHKYAFNYYNSSFKSQPNIYVAKGTRKQYLSEDPWSGEENIIEVEFLKK